MIQRSSWVRLKYEFHHWNSDKQRTKIHKTHLTISWNIQLEECSFRITSLRRWPCSQAVQVHWLSFPSSTNGISKRSTAFGSQVAQGAPWHCILANLGHSQPISRRSLESQISWYNLSISRLLKELEIKLAGSHEGQIQNFPAREDFTVRAEELTHFLTCFTLNGDTFLTENWPQVPLLKGLGVWSCKCFDSQIVFWKSIKSPPYALPALYARLQGWLQRQSFLLLTQQRTISDGSSGTCLPSLQGRS